MPTLAVTTSSCRNTHGDKVKLCLKPAGQRSHLQFRSASYVQQGLRAHCCYDALNHDFLLLADIYNPCIIMNSPLMQTARERPVSS